MEENHLALKENIHLNEINISVIRTRSNTTDSDFNTNCDFSNNNQGTVIDSKYRLIRTIAKGTNSKLKLALDFKENKNIILKIQIKDNNNSFIHSDTLNKEAQSYKTLKYSENIVKCIDKNMQATLIKHKKQIKHKKCSYIALEYANKGDMFNFININKGFDFKIARYYFKALIITVNSMHKHNIAHRDIKIDNMLLNNEYKLKLSDFEFCAHIKNENLEHILHEDKLGTVSFMAPEFFDYKKIKVEKGKIQKLTHLGDAVDIFACGVVLFTMLFGTFPFVCAERYDEHYKYFFSEETEKFWEKFILENSNSKRLENLNSMSKDLIERMFDVNSEKRIKIEEVMNHPFFTEENEDVENVKKYMDKIWSEVKEINDQLII